MSCRHTKRSVFMKSTAYPLSLFSLALLFVSLFMIGIAGWQLYTLPSADAYTDKGIYTFLPYEVLPIQVKNNSSGRQQRMNPTRTVWRVYYKTAEHSGYRWHEDVVSKRIGQDIIARKQPVKRRVLSLTEGKTYITVPPELSAGRYISKLQRRYLGILGIGAFYLILYFSVRLFFFCKSLCA